MTLQNTWVYIHVRKHSHIVMGTKAFIKGRTSGCTIKNAMADGMEVMFSIGSKTEIVGYVDGFAG